MTRSQIRNMAISRGKFTNSTNLTDDFNSDIQEGIDAIAGMADFNELMATDTLTLALADGDTTYSLNTNCDKVEQMRITSPTSYAMVIPEIDKKFIRTLKPVKSILGTASPSNWYYSEPTISNAGVETKKVSFDVMPDQAYTVTYSYKGYPPTLDSDADYPFFNPRYHRILVNYVVWKYSERNPDATRNPVYYKNEWEQGLAELLANGVEQSTMELPVPSVRQWLP